MYNGACTNCHEEIYIEQQCVKPEQILESINNQKCAIFLIDPTIEIHREKLLIKADA